MDYFFKITDQKERIIHYFTQERFGVLWYISAIFWMNLILFGLYRLFRGNKLALLIASIVMAVVAQVYYYGGGKSVIFNLDIVCAMFVFFVCGYIARKIDLFSKLECNYIAWFLLCIIIALVVGSFNNFHIGDRVDIYYNQYGIAPIMYLAAAFGTLGISCLCHKIHSRGLAYLGRNSMIIYAWHQTTVFTIVQEVFKQALGRNFAALQYRIAEMFVSMVLSLVIFIAVTEYISRTKAAKYFGVKQQELIDRQ